jgi:hypothetical protein
MNIVLLACESEILSKLNHEENLSKPCYILLKEKSRIVYEKQGKQKIIHPLFEIDKNRSNAIKEWRWFEQALITYQMIDKKITFIPKGKESILDQYLETVERILSRKELVNYKPIHQTIPIKLTEYGKAMYSCLNDRSTNRIGWENILKADHSKWINQQKIEFIDFDQLKTKNKKLNISNVFKISIQKNLKPNWTEKQVKWIESGINLKKIFTSNLKTIARIDDFRRKFFFNYWHSIRMPCPLCDSKKFSPSHLFNDCKKVEQWEIKVYKSFKRKARIESQNDCYSENHTFSWIYNWCITC